MKKKGHAFSIKNRIEGRGKVLRAEPPVLRGDFLQWLVNEGEMENGGITLAESLLFVWFMTKAEKERGDVSRIWGGGNDHR